MNPRPYQTEAGNAFARAVSRGETRSMIVLPTGCGKTVTGLHVAERIMAKRGAPVLWIAHREELISQPVKTLRAVNPERTHGVVKAERNEWNRDVVFASIQTATRDHRLAQLAKRRWSMLVVDEAHHAAATSYVKVLQELGGMSGVPVLGLTATPERGDGGSLEKVFDSICYQLHLKQAVESGYLVGVEVQSVRINVDLDTVAIRQGDFAAGDLDLALMQAGIVGSVCDAYQEHAADRKAIVFTVGVKQAEAIAEEMKARGVAAEAVSGETQTQERRDILKRLKSGDTRVVCNCQVLTEGFDEPSVDCIMVARPTKSKSLYIQMVGRGLRLHPGKSNCLIVDMVGLSNRHTLIQAPVVFGMETEQEARERTAKEVDPQARSEYWVKRILSQVEGVASMQRSEMRWMTLRDGLFGLPCGRYGTVTLEQVGDDEYSIYVLGRRDAGDREPLSSAPVDLELGQGIAEDYVRQFGDTGEYYASKDSAWRSLPPSEKQLRALEKFGVTVHAGMSRGDASDIITLKSTTSAGLDPATPKQLAYLRRLGVSVDRELSKREAGRLIAGSKG